MSTVIPDDHVICPGCSISFHAVSQASKDRIRELEESACCHTISAIAGMDIDTIQRLGSCGCRQATRDERARIVAWLRAQANTVAIGMIADDIRGLADAIERGEPG